jgi:MoxR-like ATPase
VILLDEITNADAGELAPLNGLLEPNAAVSYGGRVWRRAAGVLVFAADNTFGNGDETGRHTGTRAQNVALIDRFSRVIPFTFLPATQEIDAIINRSGCSIAIAEHVHAAIDVAREKVKQAEIVDAPSIRSAIAFCRALQDLHPRDAWETTIVARQPSESAATLRGIYELCISESFVANNI